MGRITGQRGDVVVRQSDMVPDLPTDSQDKAQEIIASELVNLASKTVDLSRPFDEYQYAGGAVSTLEVLPEYEVNEIVQAIFIAAPASATVALQLGNWTANLVMPASAFILIAPVAFRLSRHDRRIITLGSSGICSLRLTGHADMSGW